MEQIFQKLSTIKAVEPDSDLYDTIIHRIQKRNTISPVWLRAAASVMLLLFSAEFVYLKDEFLKESTNHVEELIPSSNNLLYNE